MNMNFKIKIVFILILNVYIISSVILCAFLNFQLLTSGSEYFYLYAINLIYLILAVFLAFFQGFASLCFRIRDQIAKNNKLINEVD